MVATSQIYAHVKHIEDFINEGNRVRPNDSNLATEDIYQTLMKKEEKVLDTINNMTEHKRIQESEAGLFINMSLHSIVRKTFKVLTELMNALQQRKNSNEIMKELLKEKRLIYVGLFIVFISMFLLLLTL